MIAADPALYYQNYGVMCDGRLETDFRDDNNPFEHASARGEINAIVIKDLDNPCLLPSDEQSGN